MSSCLADKIEPWPTTRLIPSARNARTHSPEQVAQIAASIVEFGFTNPILAGSDGVIVAGHGQGRKESNQPPRALVLTTPWHTQNAREPRLPCGVWK